MATLKIGTPTPKQIAFLEAQTRFVGYGGARGGGKSWAARVKAVLLAINKPGIQILLLRRTFPELKENHVIPLKRMLKDIAHYSETGHSFTFPNGSRIVLGYCKAEADVLQYQGQAYDVVFMEEATQFTEFQFQCLTESNRISGLCTVKFEPRFYITCNPGGVGHAWVKRLFIDKQYKNSEREEDYTFIKSLVYDNDFIMENDPGYVRMLENLPEDRRKAMLYGDWDVYEGQYFSEFDREIHVIKPFNLPAEWRRYFVMDYGLDMLAGYWIAVDELGRAYPYREIYRSGLTISDAIREIKANTTEEIFQYIAPPDMWNRRQDTGKSVADIFAEQGIYLYRAKNDRVMGWYNVKEWLKIGIDEYGQKTSALRIFENCYNLIRCFPLAQYDDKNPNDVAKEPHEITHALDAIRYFCAGRPMPAILHKEGKKQLPFALRTDDEQEEDYIVW